MITRILICNFYMFECECECKCKRNWAFSMKLWHADVRMNFWLDTPTPLADIRLKIARESKQKCCNVTVVFAAWCIKSGNLYSFYLSSFRIWGYYTNVQWIVHIQFHVRLDFMEYRQHCIALQFWYEWVTGEECVVENNSENWIGTCERRDDKINGNFRRMHFR